MAHARAKLTVLGRHGLETLRAVGGHLWRMLPACLHVPGLTLPVSPWPLPGWALIAVGGLELLGLDHPEAAPRGCGLNAAIRSPGSGIWLTENEGRPGQIHASHRSAPVFPDPSGNPNAGTWIGMSGMCLCVGPPTYWYCREGSRAIDRAFKPVPGLSRSVPAVHSNTGQGADRSRGGGDSSDARASTTRT